MSCVRACAQLCQTICDSMDCSLPGSFVHGILQARILEWVGYSLYPSTTLLNLLSKERKTRQYSFIQWTLKGGLLWVSRMVSPGVIRKIRWALSWEFNVGERPAQIIFVERGDMTGITTGCCRGRSRGGLVTAGSASDSSDVESHHENSVPSIFVFWPFHIQQRVR